MSDLPVLTAWKFDGAQWAVVGDLPRYTSLTVERRHNDAGAWSLTVPFDAKSQAFAGDPGRILTVDWRGKQIATCFPSRIEPALGDDGGLVLNMSGLDGLSFLEWTLAWPKPESNLASQAYWVDGPAPVSGPAETVVKQLVRDNVVTRRGFAFTVPTSQARGTDVKARPAFDNLMELVCKKASRGGIGARVGLNETSSRADLRLTTYTPQDRSLRVQFSQSIPGTLRSWAAPATAPAANQAIVAGTGGVFKRVNTEASLASGALWGGTREVFVQGPETFDDAELDQSGFDALDSGAATASVTVEAADSANQQAIRDYDAGDLARVSLLTGLSYTDVISSIKVSVGDDGPTVEVTFGDPDATNPIIRQARLIRAIRRDVSLLKRLPRS